MRHYVISLIYGYLCIPAVPVNFACSLCISLHALTVPRHTFFLQFSSPDYLLILRRPTAALPLLLEASLPQLCNEDFLSFAHHGIPFSHLTYTTTAWKAPRSSMIPHLSHRTCSSTAYVLRFFPLSHAH